MLVFVLGLFVALGLAACGGSASTAANEPATEEESTAAEAAPEPEEEDSQELGAADFAPAFDEETHDDPTAIFSKGSWEFVGPVIHKDKYDPDDNIRDPSADAAFDVDNMRCLTRYRGDQVEFWGFCDLPKGPIPGGESEKFPISLYAQDASFDEGYRQDSSFLGAAVFDVSNPHDLYLSTSGYSDNNAIRFQDMGESDDCDHLSASVWKDPVDPDKDGSVEGYKVVTWRFPIGTVDGQKLTIWSVDEGFEGTGGASGGEYVWRSETGLEPNAEPELNLDLNRDVSGPTYVLTGYELFPGAKGEGERVRDCALYVDRKNNRVVSTYLVCSKDAPQNWGFFESAYEFPPFEITAGSTATIAVTNRSLGGYGFAASLGAGAAYGRDIDSWEDTMLRFSDSDGNRTVSTGNWMEDDAFTSVYKELECKFGDYDFPDDGKEHTLKIVYYDGDGLCGSAIAWNYTLVR